MKKPHLPWHRALTALLAFLLLFSPLLAENASAASLSEGGYIVLPENPDDRLTAAADTLAKYLNQITGKSWPVATSGEGIRFVLGYTDAIADNGYIIETGENEVSIQGSGTRGVIRGVYGFLEKYCHCFWYTFELYVIPENPDLTIPAGEKTEYAPFFEYTDTDWVSPRDTEYSLANGLTGGVYRDIPAELGGTVDYLNSFAHTLSTSLCAASTYFEEHPEYFALHDGVRQPEQLCLTNEEVYEIVRDEVFAILEASHDPEASLQIISLTQADNEKMCLCDSCAALDAKYSNGETRYNEIGGLYKANGSGSMISFVNRIARDVKAAGYDNVAIDTFAYRYTRSAPVGIEIEDNVIVRLCTIECCFAHALDDETCTDNAEFYADLQAWSKLCDRLYIWNYNNNYAYTLGIFPNFGVMQKNTQIFVENNVAGIYQQGNQYMSVCNTEFGELKAYLLSKLMQDPYMDYGKAIDQFLSAYYGDAAPYLREFINMTIEKPTPNNGHNDIYDAMQYNLGFHSADVKKANELWEAAKNAVQENETFLSRVERSELSWRFWKLTRNYAGVSEFADYKEDLNEFGVTVFNEVHDWGRLRYGMNEYLDAVFLTTVFQMLTPILFAVMLAVLAFLTIRAFVKNDRKWSYLITAALTIALWIFARYHKELYLKGGMFLIPHEIGMAVVMGIIGGFLIKSKKGKIIGAISLPILWFGLYSLIMIPFHEFVYDYKMPSFTIEIAHLMTVILGLVVFAIPMKEIFKKHTRQ